MKLENQVTSLEISKRLKELKAPNKGLYAWVNPPTISTKKEPWRLCNWQPFQSSCVAFTVAELGEMLPNEVFMNDKTVYLSFTRHKGLFRVHLQKECRIESITEADARGKMLIYLLENNLLK